MIPVNGYAAARSEAPLAPHSFERRDPRQRDLLIDIRFCGVCHSDIHQARDEWGGSIFPMVPGHEIAGVVSRVGSAVKKFKVGDAVGVEQGEKVVRSPDGHGRGVRLERDAVAAVIASARAGCA